MPYRSLNAEKIIESADLLCQRVQERFPNRGICRVCTEAKQVAHEARKRAEWIANPHWGFRTGIGVLILLLAAASLAAFSGLLRWIDIGNVDLISFLEVINNGINDVIFIGAGLFFLISLEGRVKRRRALRALHELRSLAHVIDMHQLTKDPERVLKRGTLTSSSPIETMSLFELSRYLDYCSELLSLIGKIAALYVENFDDSVALSAVNEIEDLTTGLSRKIWQKIMILNSLETHGLVASQTVEADHRPHPSEPEPVPDPT